MNQQQLIIVYISYTISSLSFLCTLTNLWLIHIMKKWNGYLAIITAMCYCQIIYDVSFALHISIADGGTMVSIWNSFQFFGGLSVSIWTNVLAFVILRVVVNMRNTDILKNFNWFRAIVMIPSVAIGVALLVLQLVGRRHQVYYVEEIYYWARLISILINFIIHGIVSYRSYQTKMTKWTRRSPQEIAIQILSQRMIYYPLMQALSRVGASWYEAKYGFGPYPGHTSERQFGLACVYVGLSPATGIGYLVVFLLMQPFAIDQVRSLLTTGRAIDPKVLESRKEGLRRSSYLGRNTLIRGTAGSELGGTSSVTSPSDMQNNASSMTTPAPSVKEDEAEFYLMDDDELVATIHRAAARGTFMQQYGSSEQGGSTTTDHSGQTSSVVTNPFASMGSAYTDQGSMAQVARAGDFTNDQL
jgi:hypothetical protein